MNCKPGDLAVIVRSICGNEGKVVRCLRFRPGQLIYGPDGIDRVEPVWEVDLQLRCWDGTSNNLVADERLRPIRPDGITDEEVRDLYQPAPAKETV